MAEKPKPRRLRYEESLLAAARYAERERLRDICVIEVEGGLVVQGQAMVSTREGFTLALKTQVLSHEELERLLERKQEGKP
jgi:hypothetical protein